MTQSLQEIRKNSGLSLSEIAGQLKIQRKYLEAIECGNFSDLPERVYAVGFIKNYADFLGTDPSDIIQAFDQELLYSQKNPKESALKKSINAANDYRKKYDWFYTIFSKHLPKEIDIKPLAAALILLMFMFILYNLK